MRDGAIQINVPYHIPKLSCIRSFRRPVRPLSPISTRGPLISFIWLVLCVPLIKAHTCESEPIIETAPISCNTSSALAGFAKTRFRESEILGNLLSRWRRPMSISDWCVNRLWSTGKPPQRDGVRKYENRTLRRDERLDVDMGDRVQIIPVKDTGGSG